MKRHLLIAIMALLTMLAPIAATATPASTYAENSALATGKWAKIRIASTGICRLTPEVARQAGFADFSKVKVYGYGGGMIPEKLTPEWLAKHEDLQEMPTCTVGNAKYFLATGTVSWDSHTAKKRTRNPYSTYGYYFITDAGGAAATCTEAALREAYTNSAAAHHYLYENDQYSWSQFGRNLVDGTEIPAGATQAFEVIIPSANTSANIQVCLAAGADAAYNISCGTKTASGYISFVEYDMQRFNTKDFSVTDVQSYLNTADGTAHYPVTIKNTGKTPLRLDYISAYFTTPYTAPALGANCPAAEFVEFVPNQNRHADKVADLTIIIPSSRELYNAANRLAQHHRDFDGMSVRIVTAKELYNEFSSGTPDVSAFKRYMKMFYDRGEMEGRTPRPAVLLFGDAVWDNRMLTLSPVLYSQNSYLPGFQTEDSENKKSSIIADDFITVMQDNRTIHVDDNRNSDPDLRFDIGVGRIPVTTPAQANAVVDKLIHYATSAPEGNWQNEIVFIGDDGDNNSHMTNININANAVIHNTPGYHVKKVMADAYELKTLSTGDSYPEVTSLLKKQQNNGALIMNYGGHSAWTLLSHEKLLVLNDFLRFKGDHYSLWVTAGCESVPYDQTFNTLGEAALLNPEGGAIAFFGTVRTVMEHLNSYMDLTFMKHVLAYDANGLPNTLGEAQRLAKNDLVAGTSIQYKNDITGKISTATPLDRTINKHHYTLIGDPMLRLALPKAIAKVDRINDHAIAETEIIQGNSIVTISGHIEDRDGNPLDGFNGTANILVRDSEKAIQCRNNQGDNDTFTYNDRNSNLYKGVCKVRDGQFQFTFRVPRDIINNGENGLVTIYAIDTHNKTAANGECDNISAQGWEDVPDDGQGPSIYCYLNTPAFHNGDGVGHTPFFVAELTDRDGLNATGTSLGHNMELTVDGEASKTYNLTDNFVFNEDSYTSGRTHYVLEPLEAGAHQLEFKAWDLLGNSNSVALTFWVKRGMAPNLVHIKASPNPVKGSTTFYVTHDMQGSNARVRIEIISPSGKLAQALEWYDTFSETSPTTTYKWTPSGLERGLYLYRVRLSCDNSEFVSKTEKLIIAQ